MAHKVLQFYQRPGLSEGKVNEKLVRLRNICSTIISLETEYCCYVGSRGDLDVKEKDILQWILCPTFESIVRENDSQLRTRGGGGRGSGGGGTRRGGGGCELLVEVGPRLNFSTAYSTNAVSVCAQVGLREKVTRIERSTLYLIRSEGEIDGQTESRIVCALHDRMTEQRYKSPITSFKLPINSQPWLEIDVLNQGTDALQKINREMGLAFDDQDLSYYTSLFQEKLKRNPTSVECFDLAQSNSEHSRHWFFKGRMIVNGKELEKSLLDMIIETQNHTNDNNVIKFNDNSSAIKGFRNLDIMVPVNSSEASLVEIRKDVTRHIIFTAETHNFPTGVAPFQGATTGTGGRIRDTHAAGRGSHVIAGTAGYCFGNLLIPGYELPWEGKGEVYPGNFASPLDICIEASNGASDYGNKFGEPVLAGFARSFGLRTENGERREWIKPIMFSAGIGSIDDAFITKGQPEIDMLVTKVGGPIYRIGVGGGAASSIEIQGDEVNEELNYGAVQRGDPEMEQKLNRVIRACIEYNGCNPIQSIHDQGAGGNGNVLKEIVDPQGAVIYTNRFTLGDPTINTLELWGAEYQETDAILVRVEDKEFVTKIGAREKCPINFVGHVTGDGHIRLQEHEGPNTGKNPVDLDLRYVLASMPRKVFDMKTETPLLKPFALPANVTFVDALNRVLRLPSVSSKRYLTNKVDRSVTGLVAQQQCIGPLHTPLADYAAIALSYFNHMGSATSIGEQPIKGLISPSANARMSVAEALTNLMFICISDIADVKCSGNWMWAAKLSGEGAKLVEACQAMCEVMKVLGIGIDGGKDSLAMAAKVKLGPKGQTETVKAPGSIVISVYAPVPDIRLKVTPLLRGGGKLVYVCFGDARLARVGGTALAQVFGQLGDKVPDLEKPELLRKGFAIVQNLIRGKHCTAGHDVSDGGIITCLLEMAFGSNCGLEANFEAPRGTSAIEYLFAEECGVIIEVRNESVSMVEAEFKQAAITARVIGEANFDQDLVQVKVNNQLILEAKMSELRDIWEETSFQLERLQANPKSVLQEQEGLKGRKNPNWKLTFDANETRIRAIDNENHFSSRPRVAVIREEGINGDREMIASLYMVGFEVADVMITDILGERNLTLGAFRGLIFPGGFSYADVLGSARGWAATMKFNPKLEEQLNRFKARSDTFSLGVCNGCQLLALLGWVGHAEDGSQGTLLAQNDSERFESRFVSVKIERNTRSIMLKGMHDSVLGVWVAHGEGKFLFRDAALQESLLGSDCVALRYTDDDGNPTTRYPMNPNGSPAGLAGVCSPNGRHLAMMPHPERCTNLWQWPYLPKSWDSLEVSPWSRMFRNAYDWCLSA